ncbi:flagellar hook-associated protein FlgK [Hydrogenophaga sp. 5NK40-0174]|uniref:flagellar hook-associated protein FlgK n=1 Tax=Hydrogenophaga sp. 5NK40-0174 TaxID=3127649 RepID=UPI0031033B4A
MSTAALNIGSRALTTHLSALQVVGHNIANVNTEGYSRQEVHTRQAGYQELGGLFYGKGVELSTVRRAHDAFLTREAQVTASVAAADSTRLSQMQRLESFFPLGDDGLGAAVNDMLNAWSDVADSPSDLSARVVALSRADDLASRMRDTAAQLDYLASSGRQQAIQTVADVNRLAGEIAELNQQVLENQGAWGEPNDLLDQRDQLIAELSKLVQVSTVNADDGSISVFAGGSQPLVLGRNANELKVTRDPMDASRSHVTFMQAGVSMEMADANLGGELGGLMVFLNDDLPSMTNQLGRMALSIATQMNTQHTLGLDMNGNPGADLFVPPADAPGLAHTDNTGTAQLHASVLDASQLVASDYELSFDAAGVSIRRISDNTVTSYPGLPVQIDGLSIELDAGAANNGDKFLIRPYAQAAKNLDVALSAPNQLAVASPVQVSPGVSNNGGVSVEALYPVSPSANLTDPVTITFQADGSFVATGLGPGNPAPDNPGPPATYNYTPGQPIEFNGWSLTLRGSPAPGDSFDVTAALPGQIAQNGGNAEAMLALRDTPAYDGIAMGDSYSSLISHLGTKVQGAKFSAQFSEQVAASAEDARSSVAGVNLDEEAARLLQYQQSYQAAAKFLQVAQGSFDTLMQTVGR